MTKMPNCKAMWWCSSLVGFVKHECRMQALRRCDKKMRLRMRDLNSSAQASASDTQSSIIVKLLDLTQILGFNLWHAWNVSFTDSWAARYFFRAAVQLISDLSWRLCRIRVRVIFKNLKIRGLTWILFIMFSMFSVISVDPVPING